jgi:hypothetical protein
MIMFILSLEFARQKRLRISLQNKTGRRYAQEAYLVKTSSAKAKGRRLQQYLASKLLEAAGILLSLGDINSTPMGSPGEDLWISPTARKLYPISFECKNQEALNIWEALAQAERNSKGNMPAVVFKRNNSKVYITLELDHFLKFLPKNWIKDET